MYSSYYPLAHSLLHSRIENKFIKKIESPGYK